MHLVVTLHGIRTFGVWQDRLKLLLEKAEPGVDVRCYRYNYLSVLGFLFPPVRWIVTRRFRRELVKVCRERSWDRIDIVAHSLGTHIAAWALHGLPPPERPQIHTVIFAGSVLRSGFPWIDLVPTCVKRVVNECGIHDNVLILSQFFSLFTGMAGRVGFVGMEGGAFANRYFPIGHSGYFRAVDTDSDLFMRDRWVPLLTSEAPIVQTQPRDAPTPAAGVVQFLTNNAEAVKLILYVAPLLAIILGIYGLWQGAVSRELAAKAVADLLLDPHASVLNAVSAAEVGRNAQTEEAVDRAYEQANVEVVFPDPRKRRPPAPVIGAAFSPDGRWVLITNDHRESWLWEVSTRSYRGPFANYPLLRISAESFKPHSKVIALSAYDEDARKAGAILWDWNNSANPVNFKVASEVGWLSSVSFSPSGKSIVTAGADFTASVRDSETLVKRPVEFNKRGSLHSDIINSARFSRDEKWIVTASQDGHVRVWEIDTGKRLADLSKGSTSLFSVEFSPSDPNIILTASQDRTATLWDLRKGTYSQTKQHGADVRQATFDCGGKRFITASVDGTARVWDVGDLQEPLVVLTGHQGALTSAGFSRTDRNLVVTGSLDGTARIWRINPRLKGALSFEQKLAILKQRAQDLRHRTK